MEVIYMNINILKSNAKQSIKDAKPSPMIAYLIVAISNGIQVALNGSYSTVVNIISVVVSILSMVINTGFIWYTIEVARNQNPITTDVFNSFHCIGKVIALNLLIFLKVFLWSLLLIVPGVIKAYSYSMSLYVLHDHPEWSVSQCMEESESLMKGNKGNLFELQLSMLGWLALMGVVSLFVGIILGLLGLSTLVIGILVSVCVAPFVIYICTAKANFYDEVVNKKVYDL
jgi:uncharacterized membrane protein